MLDCTREPRCLREGDLPTPAAQNGTFGRFRYSPARHVFIAVNATQEDVFIYKPPVAAP